MKVTFASNHGVFGGGEVMLFALAEAARNQGHEVTIVAPAAPSDVVDEARRLGFGTVAISGRSSAAYLVNLRMWDARQRRGDGVLWCNGLRPALATAGHRRRVVHLHQEPGPRLRRLAELAQAGALATVVPSQAMASRLTRPCVVMPNWTAELPARRPRRREPGGPLVVGYLGRLSFDKGVHVLVSAVKTLREQGLDARLLVAGDTRFVAASEAMEIEGVIASLGSIADHRGWMERGDFFDAVDVAVFPSVWREPFGLVVAESMAARCPFVVSDAGALPEVAGADYPFIAPRDDAQGLADVLRAAIAEPGWSQRLDSSHHRWVREFSPAAGRERLAALLTRIQPQPGSEQ